MSTSSSRRYHQIKNWIFVASLILDVAFLLFIFFSGLTFELKQLASRWAAHGWAVNGLYLLLFSQGAYLVHFPLNYFSGFVWEHRFQLSNQKMYQWLWDDLKKSLLGFVVVLLLVEMIYLLLGRYPNTWWIGAGFFWLLLTYVLAKLTPQVIIPLFYKYQPIANPALKEKIFQLFKDCRIALKDIYAINLSAKTKKANAFLCGLGRNRRVVLSDTLVDNFTIDEIEAVVAHELGHYQHKDILKMLIVNSLTVFCGLYLVNGFLHESLARFGLKELDDISFFPMIALAFLLFGLVTTPFINGFSRWMEREADRFSLEKTKRPGDFISMMQKLGKMNLAEENPGRLVEFFLYDHPPINQRIAFAERFK